MAKSQFNIKISKDLLVKVKRQAMMSGKSLTEHITDLVSQSLSENNFENDNFNYFNKLKEVEDRLLTLESTVKNREYLSQKFKPFTNAEAINCTKYMKGVFDNELLQGDFDDKSHAFDDFLKHLNNYVQLSDVFIYRVKEIMLSDDPKPFTGKELNNITENVKCNCPIRKALINWTGKLNTPSQQEICDKGEKLLALL
tara:strand:+ start:431 stop:1024 length:594 start_codon:yes stop_codon:yes gene_type:complete